VIIFLLNSAVFKIGIIMFFRNQATFTKAIKAGTSTKGQITPAEADHY
jgi:hypothetical protein